MRFVVLLLGLALAGNSIAQDAVKVKIPPPNRMLGSAPSPDGSGRFVAGQISDFRSDQYLLDTKTGRMWQILDGTPGGKVLQPVLVLSDDNKSAGVQVPH